VVSVPLHKHLVAAALRTAICKVFVNPRVPGEPLKPPRHPTVVGSMQSPAVGR
jgi:hypothetical protein